MWIDNFTHSHTHTCIHPYTYLCVPACTHTQILSYATALEQTHTTHTLKPWKLEASHGVGVHDRGTLLPRSVTGIGVMAEMLISCEVSLSAETAATDTSEVYCKTLLIDGAVCWQIGCEPSHCAHLVPLFPVLTLAVPAVTDTQSLYVGVDYISPSSFDSMAWSLLLQLSKQQLFWQVVLIHASHMAQPLQPLLPH